MSMLRRSQRDVIRRIALMTALLATPTQNFTAVQFRRATKNPALPDLERGVPKHVVGALLAGIPSIVIDVSGRKILYRLAA